MRRAVVLVLVAACAGDRGDEARIDPSELNACSASDYIVNIQKLADAMEASDAPDAVAAANALQLALGQVHSAPGCFSEVAPPPGSLIADCTPAGCAFSVTTSGADGDFVSLMGDIARADDELTISVVRRLSASSGASISTDATASLRAPMAGHASYVPSWTGQNTYFDHAGVEVDRTGCPIRGAFDVTLYSSGAADPESRNGTIELGPTCAR